jgi:hypothetical protein
MIVRVAAEHDIGAAAGHVRGDGDGAEFTGLGHDFGFLFMLLGVEDVVLYPALFQHCGEQLALLYGNGAHQHRLALFVAGDDLVDDGSVLAIFVFINNVGDDRRGLQGLLVGISMMSS